MKKVESQAYYTSAIGQASADIEREQILRKIKDILEHKLYNERSKVELCLSLLKENKYDN